MSWDKPKEENVMLQYASATKYNYQTWDLSKKTYYYLSLCM